MTTTMSTPSTAQPSAAAPAAHSGPARGSSLRAGATSRGRRLIAALIAALLGTAFLTASIIALDSSRAAVAAAIAGGLRTADLVVSDGESASTPVELDAVAALPGVQSVLGEGMTGGMWRDSFVSVVNLRPGADVTAGVLPSRPGEVAVTTTLADAGVGVGDTLTLQPYGDGDPPPAELSVVGVVKMSMMSDLGHSPAAMATDATLRNLDPNLTYRALLVHLDPPATADSVRTAITELLPGRSVQTGPEAARARVTEMTGRTDLLSLTLLAFSGVALVTSAMVIATTFTITLAQRTAELALLRCVGATTRQVRRLVLLEAVVIGALAAALGVLTGVGIALLGVRPLRSTGVDLPLDAGAVITMTALLIPFLVGLVVTVLSAVLPTVRATRVSPLEALRPAGAVATRRRFPWLRMLSGTAAFLVGLALMVLAASSRDVWIGMLGGCVSFAGVLLAAVALVPGAARVLGLAARPTGVPGRLAVDHAVRNPGRTAATSAALLVAVTLITMTTIGAATAEQTAVGEIDDTYALDFVITASPDGATTDWPTVTPLDTSIAGRVADIDDVAAAMPVPAAYLTLGEQDYPTMALGLDASVAKVVHSPAQLEDLTPGTLGLSGRMQAIHGLTTGDVLTVTGSSGSRELRVVTRVRGHGRGPRGRPAAIGGDAARSGAVLVRATDRANSMPLTD